MGLSIVIPTWNGIHLLRENLPSVVTAAQRFSAQTGSPYEIIVVDDASSDDTRSKVPEEFPGVTLVEREVNGGFSAACNSGFRLCRHPVVALLNNDVRVVEDYFLPLIEHFQDPDVFAVTARVFEYDQPVFATGGKIGRFRKGFWSGYFNYDVAAPQAQSWIADRRLLSFYAVGGFAAYDRSKLQVLGGFCELLSPFHWEDIELSYRAWKRGWEVRFEPRALAFHRTSATIGAHFRRRKVDEVAVRNRILFHWINLHDPAWLAAHAAMLGLLLASRILVGDMAFYRALGGALRRIRPALSLRRIEKSSRRRSDRQVARLLRDFYDRAPLQSYFGRSEVLDSHPGLAQAAPEGSPSRRG